MSKVLPRKENIMRREGMEKKDGICICIYNFFIPVFEFLALSTS